MGSLFVDGNFGLMQETRLYFSHFITCKKKRSMPIIWVMNTNPDVLVSAPIIPDHPERWTLVPTAKTKRMEQVTVWRQEDQHWTLETSGCPAATVHHLPIDDQYGGHYLWNQATSTCLLSVFRERISTGSLKDDPRVFVFQNRFSLRFGIKSCLRHLEAHSWNAKTKQQRFSSSREGCAGRGRSVLLVWLIIWLGDNTESLYAESEGTMPSSQDKTLNG